jgi:hypothetical protein
MRTNYLVILLFVFGISQAQKQPPLDYSKFETTDLKSDILIKKTSLITSLDKERDTYGMYGFLQTYKELSFNDSFERFDQLEKLQQICKPINYSKITKIGFIHSQYETIKKESFTNGDIEIVGNTILRKNNAYIFNNHTTTIIAPLIQTKRGLTTTYILDSAFFVNNTDDNITQIKVNFDDGNGFQKLEFNTPIQVSYSSKGTKNIEFKIEFNNNQVINRFSSVTIDYSNANLNSLSSINSIETSSSVVADLSGYSGAIDFAGLAEYEIFLGADNVLDKPIFLVDGFDPGDTRNIASVYNLLSYDNSGTTENLGDRIRTEEDFDVVIINLPQYFRLSNGTLQSMANSTDVNNDGVIDTADYPGSTLVDGGSDFVERNAMLLAEIITIINGQKTGTEQNVVIGPSMGGLITRYALNYMEQQSINHDTRLWLSFDSPHRGANTPIGFQHLFNFLAYGLGSNSVDSIRPIVDGMLKSPAARQMLVDHFEPHLASGEAADFDPSIILPVAHDYHNTFYTSIEGLTTSGFPETTRNIAIINGSGIGSPYQHQNGSNVLPSDNVLTVEVYQTWPDPDLELYTYFTPPPNQTIVIDDAYIDMPWPVSNVGSVASSKSHSYSSGVDAAPGGLFDLGALAGTFSGSGDATIDAFFDGLNVDWFNFIPAVSGLALNDINLDWVHNINLGTTDTPWDGVTTSTSTQTPFVNWFMPDDNEAHVTLTTANVAFAWEEIVEPLPLDVSEFDIADNSIKLLKNPASGNQVSILSSLTNINELNITLYDVNGRNVFEQTKENSNIINFSPKVTNGLYILTIKDYKDNDLLNTKVVILN